MRQIYDITGAQVHPAREYDIASATAIKEGQVVKLAAGLVVAAAVAETGAIIGYAAENHSGAADALDPRANGTKILVADSPTAVARSLAPQITATGGSTTTIVATGLAADFLDDDFNGGYAKLISKAAASANTDPVGTIYAISDFDTSDQTMTINTAGGAVTAGDVFAIFPPIGFAKGNLDSNIQKLVLSATAALPIKVVGKDLDKNEVHHMASLHLLSNKTS